MWTKFYPTVHFKDSDCLVTVDWYSKNLYTFKDGKWQKEANVLTQNIVDNVGKNLLAGL